MLDLLPDELILEIASYLNFYVKQALVKTCRKLNKLLYNTILFEEFRIPEKHNDKIIDLFINGQLDSYKVKKVDINYVNEEDVKCYYQMLMIFPELKVLCKSEHKEYGWKVYLDNVGFKHDLLKSKQQQVSIRKLTIILLEKHKFNHITHLCLEPTIQTKTDEIHIDFFACLSNAVSLESLQTEKFRVNLEFLEQLHKANPGLKSLILKHTFIELNENSSRELLIEPNCQLESFKLLYTSRFCDKKCLLIPYMVKKYPKLKTLDMYSWVRSSYPNAWDYGAVETYNIYNLCIHNLISYLAPQLETFKFEPKLFGKLINNNCKKSNLKRLVLYQSSSTFRHTTSTFEKINSLLYIQSFDSLTSLSLNAEEWIVAISVINDNKIEITVPNIKRFHLFQRYYNLSQTSTIDIELNQLLAIFCQLESLRVIGNTFTITSVNDSTTTYPQLTKLALCGKQIQPKVTELIKLSLPNVIELYWESELHQVNFDLPLHSLKTFNLCIFDTPNMYNHSISTWKIHYHVTRTNDYNSRDLYYSKKSKRDHKVTEVDDDTGHYQAFVKVDIVCRNILQLMDDTTVIF